MLGQHFRHHRNPFRCRDVRQAKDAGVCCFLVEDQRTEVRINRDENTTFGDCPFEDSTITRIGTSLRDFCHVVTFCAQPISQAATGTAINEKSHFAATRTASRESWAITACA